MNKELIQKYMHTKELGNFLELFDKIKYSTNRRVAEHIEGGIPNSVVLADVQEGGRGRTGRSWLSGDTGESIAMSFSICPDIDITALPVITLIVSLAVADAIDSAKVKIKWPNDIYVNGKKVCGILCELKNFGGKNYIIVGVGINFSQKDFPSEFEGSATSLVREGVTKTSDGIILTREIIVARILNSFEKRLDEYIACGFTSQQEEYKKIIYGLGESAKILDSSVSNSDIKKAKLVAEGEIIGINERGEILLSCANETIGFSSGELSLRLK